MPMPMTAGSRGAGGLFVIGQASFQASKQPPGNKQQESNALSIVYSVDEPEARGRERAVRVHELRCTRTQILFLYTARSVRDRYTPKGVLIPCRASRPAALLHLIKKAEIHLVSQAVDSRTSSRPLPALSQSQ